MRKEKEMQICAGRPAHRENARDWGTEIATMKSEVGDKEISSNHCGGRRSQQKIMEEPNTLVRDAKGYVVIEAGKTYLTGSKHPHRRGGGPEVNRRVVKRRAVESKVKQVTTIRG